MFKMQTLQNPEFKTVPDVIRRVHEKRWSNNEKAEELFVTPCQERFPVQIYETEDRVRTEHVDKCDVCKVLTGKSHAHVFNQNQVAHLWALGYVPVRTSNGNVDGTDLNELTHYSTTAAIRTKTGDIIVNSQDYSTGFASVPRIPDNLVKGDLPLSTIQGEIIHTWRDSHYPLNTIKIIEHANQHTLFSMNQKAGDDLPAEYYLHGFDDSAKGRRRIEFIVKLAGPSQTVADAIENLKPGSVKVYEKISGEPATRQGDIFFLPVKNIESFYVDKYNTPPTEKAHFETEIIDRYNGESGDWEKATVRVLKTPQVVIGGEDTRHSANEKLGRLVRKWIRHPEHQPINLGLVWHIPVKNTALQSWTVAPRGGGGRD
jgi:hypothetical protein